MADVASTFAQWSPTDNSNGPSGTTTVGSGVDDNFRAVQAVAVRGLSHKGADIASAATTDLGAVEGKQHTITGTTTITSFGTVRSGIEKTLIFADALTLTHNGTSLILPGAANITTAAGDTAQVMSLGSGNWKCVAYTKAASIAATLAGSETLTNKTLTAPVLNGALSGDAIAAQAEMETGTATDSIVSPGRQQFHPSAVKGWMRSDTNATLAASYNVTSNSDDGIGQQTITWATDFSSASYAVIPATQDVSNNTQQARSVFIMNDSAPAAGTTTLFSVRSDGTSIAAYDPTHWYCIACGDQ